MTKIFIRKMVDEIMSGAGCKFSMPVDLGALVLALGHIYIEYQKLPTKIEGCTIPLTTGEFIIIVNKKIPDVRRRQYVISRELGHIVLGHFDRGEIFEINNASFIKQIKTEANIFATEILRYCNGDKEIKNVL